MAFVTAIVALIVICTGLVLLPWHLRFAAQTEPPSLHMELRALAGFAPGIALTGRRQRSRHPDRKKQRPHRRRKGARRGLTRIRGIGPFLSGLISALRLRELELSGRIGLDDPADTGALYGGLYGGLAPFIYGVGRPARRIEITPDFSGRCLDLHACGEVVIRPDRLMGAGARLAWANRALLRGAGST